MKGVSERLKKESLKPFEQAQLPVVFLDSPQTDKDALARRLAAEKGIQTGPVCALSALNPIRESLFERYPTEYYWTVFQSEWATDVVFREADFLKRLMPLLVRHGMLSFFSADVMRFLGRKVNQSGEIPAHFAGTLETDL